MSRIAVTPADQQLARLDVLLAERLGEEVDPRVAKIARADLSLVKTLPDGGVPGALRPHGVWLDDESGEVYALRDGG